MIEKNLSSSQTTTETITTTTSTDQTSEEVGSVLNIFEPSKDRSPKILDSSSHQQVLNLMVLKN